MILLVSGSPRRDSANSRLLLALARLVPGEPARLTDYLADLPVFQPDRLRGHANAALERWRADLTAARAVVFATPAYLHNVPGVLKNALDWLAASGELSEKPCLVFTFTPHPPRGERARQSLLWSLEALDARVVAEGGLYQKEVSYTPAGDIAAGEQLELLTELVALL